MVNEEKIASAFEFFGLLLIVLGIVFFISIFVFLFLRTVKQNKKNNQAQLIEEEALVVSKRSQFIKVTSYYITFQLSNGERKEFSVSAKNYGLIAEGDNGTLKYQGTRFVSFIRNEKFV